MLLVTCTEDLKDLNINPKTSDEMSDGYLFTYALNVTGGRQYTAKRVNLFLCSTFIQQFANLSTGDYGVGDKYLYSNTFCSAYFDESYPQAVKELTMLIHKLKDDPEMVNNLSMARIWRAVVFHVITDLYGDVPYSEAGLGYLSQNYTPKYDTQQSIYADMLKELEEAVAAFDTSKPNWGAADLIYGGDIAKWKKFGYSMMLRLGMRMSKVDPSSAAGWVQKAVAGGVMIDNDDIAFVPRSESGSREYNQNPNSWPFHETDWDEKISKTLIDFMLETNDPRIDVMFEKGSANTVHYGMPNGYDHSTIKAYEGLENDEELDLNIYSDVNPILVNLGAPLIYMTYAEVEFMLAEASERGWGGVTNAKSHYDKGVKAAMQMFTLYDPSLSVSDEAVNTYLAANPYNSSSGFELIGEQYWIATWMNFYESYSNWRRTGYPVLTPVNYPGNESNGQIPRRIRYSSSEYSVNPSNLAEAISSMGADAFTTRVWWDVAQ
ncbi:MAG: SusD/RagB family nutrient-binding outer membrane lipoprotein [Desulfitobacteriaceae bacterium]|uniref:SusD/RagB family nutrient-binding outer membrane lipoprotein n=1 Tax=Proteiniphilum sp. UBA5346 TaxID=1947277 RepID=UPI00257B04E3|nr:MULTISPECIES: SusD/RagB family nutrient-binding outer membrane lipoprotein [unclassified Proteiniphilum]MDD2497652.1 SusD/RagB family nutrient-binding outer membrane lipoprotein [Desulfitobacteriaceae bacterium]